MRATRQNIPVLAAHIVEIYLKVRTYPPAAPTFADAPVITMFKHEGRAMADNPSDRVWVRYIDQASTIDAELRHLHRQNEALRLALEAVAGIVSRCINGNGDDRQALRDVGSVASGALNAAAQG
jgi:hypothetical protein